MRSGMIKHHFVAAASTELSMLRLYSRTVSYYQQPQTAGISAQFAEHRFGGAIDPMATITLTDEDIIRLKVILMDRDKDDALAFLRDRVLPEINKHEGQSMKSHLDGGKGSMF